MVSTATSVLHVVGVLAISQLIFWTGQRRNAVSNLDKGNASIWLHDALDAFIGNLYSRVSCGGLLYSLRAAVCIVAAIYSFFLARKLYKFAFGTFELYCPVSKTGFDFPGRELSKGLITKQEIINEVRRRKKLGEIPPPYPNGWFALLRTRELKPGASTSVNALGQNFAIFRDLGGKVYIVDAYCPHLGANLGVGGQVKGKCIECPFHGWQFDGETGVCSKIPYSSGKIPAQAKVKTWPCLEVNDFILVWYDAEGRDPQWDPEEMTARKTRGMKYCGSSTHFVNSHIEDIPENGADVSHLTFLHGAGVSSGSDTNFKDLLSGKLHSHKWTASWEALSTPHIGRMKLTMSNIILGFKIHSLDVTSRADQIGPGLVNLTLKSRFGMVLLIHSLTPQEPFLQKYCLQAFSDWWIPTFVIKMLVQGYDVQLERDMIVWNNKRYKLKPLLVREDELIRKHRRWYSQFYSENSQKFSFRKDDLSF